MTALEPDPHRALHDRLLAGEREAVADAANDALFAYFSHPHRYQPERLPLINYLTVIADRKLVDAFRRAARESTRIIFVGGSVELAEAESKNPIEPPAPDNSDKLPPELQAWVDDLLHDPRDRAFVALMCAGERDSREFAAALGMGRLPDRERAAVVKKNRDRILKRLQRRREEVRAMWECGDD